MVSTWLEERYQLACAQPGGDINEHLPLLRALAEGCDHVTELGTRWANGSTVAFLVAQPKEFIAWDLEPKHIISQPVADLMMQAGATKFQPRVGDTLKIIIEPTDLLFIDTWHVAKQLLGELERHADPTERKIRKYLVFHDTKTFGDVGEDGSVPGLRYVIRHFQRNLAFPLWEVMRLSDVVGLSSVESAKIYTHAEKNSAGEAILSLSNNNGLVVLKYLCADGHGQRTAKGQCQVCGAYE